MSGVKIVEFSSSNFEQQIEDPVDYTDSSMLKKSAINFMAKFEDISQKIEQIKQSDDYEKHRLTQGGDAFSEILSRY